MCTTCGCSDDAQPHLTGMHKDDDHKHGHDHSHSHEHDHSHSHEHDHNHEHDHIHLPAEQHGRVIQLEQDILAKNNLLAMRNRGFFEGRNVLALNLVSAPGSGKTALLERTIKDMQGAIAISVIEGDQATDNDALRIKATGATVVQINTGAGCHLEADIVAKAITELNPVAHSIVFVENVGNLVCPALFDLGEQAKVVILSTTEGEDKPLKYPHMFRAAQVLIINKIDLLPYLRFDIDKCIANALAVNPHLKVLAVSAQEGTGMALWYDWLKANVSVSA